MKVFSQQIILLYLDQIQLRAKLINDLLEITESTHGQEVGAELRHTRQLLVEIEQAIQTIEQDSFEPREIA